MKLSAIAGKPQYGWTTRAKPDGSVKLLRTTDITSGSVDWSTVPGCEAAPIEIEKYELRPGDIVVSRAGSVGFSYLVDESCPPNSVFASYLMRIHPDPTVMQPRLLYHYMRSPYYWRQVNEASVGIGLANVNGSKLSAMQVPVPPRALQDRLTRTLDSAQSYCVSASNHLHYAKRAVDRFRQAVISAACSGQLTADWRDTHHAEAHLKELLDQIDSKRKGRYRVPAAAWDFVIPDPWELVSLDRLATLITSGSRGWAKHYATDGPLFIRAQNINSDRLELTDIAHVRPPRGSEGSRTSVQRGDLLVTITGANVTKSAFVDREIGEAYVNQHVALVRPVLAELTEYLHLWIVSSQHGRKKLASDAYGAGKPGLNLDNVRTTPVGLPPLEEQIEIVTRLAKLLALADHVYERAVAATRQVERSNQAVLAKAFRGELMPVAAGAPQRMRKPDGRP
jgi:type I restriction enzyme S subunit